MASSSSTTPDKTPIPSRSPSPPASLNDVETYKTLFRRPQPPVSEPPVKCLRCALKDMECQYFHGEVKCLRCENNNEAICVFQRQDLTRPEKKPTQQEQKKAASPPRHPWLSHPLPARPEPLQCMVYTLDPELSRDRRRLLEVAAEMLQAAEGVTYVHGTPLTDAEVRGFALPSWRGNDWREKKKKGEDGDGGSANPEYRRRAEFFEGLAAENAAAAARSRRLGIERRRERKARAEQRRLESERLSGSSEEGSS